jgi:hypothetical protein
MRDRSLHIEAHAHAEINRREPMAEAKKLIAGAAYGPAELKIISNAFEAAWQDIATGYASPLAIRAARLKLANVVLSLAADGVRDGEKLRAEGVRVMRLDKAS